MNLPLSNLNSWDTVKSGTGTIVISNEGRSARLSGEVGSGAQFVKHLVASPFTLYKVSLSARSFRGTGNVWIADGGTPVNYIEVTTGRWTRYEVTTNLKITSDPLSTTARLAIGIATNTDGDIEIADVVVEEINSSFGSLQTIAAGIVTVNGGVYSTSPTKYNVASVQAEDTYTLSVTCTKLHSSIPTPMIFVTMLDTSGSQTVGRIQPRYYDKVNGKALFRFLNNDNQPVSLAGVNCFFSFEVKSC